MVKPIPDTSPRVIPTLVCRDPQAAIEFCEKVLNAEVRVRRPGPDGSTIHAALAVGEALIIVQAEFPQLASRAPQKDGSSPVVIFCVCGGRGSICGDDASRRGQRPAAGSKPVLG